MSAWNPPQASVRCHRAGSAPRKGVNFLRRPSDRFGSWFRGFLMLVLGLPVAALGARLTAYESSMRTVQTQSAERHQVEPLRAGRFRR